MDHHHQRRADRLLVALGRALETRRDDGLIDDPFAESLVAAAGEADLDPETVTQRAEDDPDVSRSLEFLTDMMAARTLRIDDEIRTANADRCRQLVLLASGLDARAARIPWAPGTTVFEVDQPAVIGFKDGSLQEIRRCTVVGQPGHRSPATSARTGCPRCAALRLRRRRPRLLARRGSAAVSPPRRPGAAARHHHLRRTRRQRASARHHHRTHRPRRLRRRRVRVRRDRRRPLPDTGEFDAQAWLGDHGWTASSEPVVSVLGEHGRGNGITSDERYSAMIGKVRIVTAHRD